MAKMTLVMKSGAVVTLDVPAKKYRTEAKQILDGIKSGKKKVVSSFTNTRNEVFAVRSSQVDAIFFKD